MSGNVNVWIFMVLSLKSKNIPVLLMDGCVSKIAACIFGIKAFRLTFLGDDLCAIHSRAEGTCGLQHTLRPPHLSASMPKQPFVL